MEMEIKREEISQIVLPDSSRFSYTIKQVEITNILGAVIAVLDEYSITNTEGEKYKLFKTKESSWYDVSDVNKGVDKSVLLGLKLSFDNL